MTRAWRFAHPDLDREEAGLHVSPTGGVEMVDDAEALRQAILLLLSTRPGERVMRPDYGCHLDRILFWPNDNTTAGLAIHYVRQAVERWEPRAHIVRLDATRSTADPSRLEIQLEYRSRATQRSDEIRISLALAEGDMQ
ncbi:MAG TPA: GPW/gp25 family protein [Thermoanaerobaculia bacterium]